MSKSESKVVETITKKGFVGYSYIDFVLLCGKDTTKELHPSALKRKKVHLLKSPGQGSIFNFSNPALSEETLQ